MSALAIKSNQHKLKWALTNPVRGAVTDVHLPVVLSPHDDDISPHLREGRRDPRVAGQPGSDPAVWRWGRGASVGDSEGAAGEMERWRDTGRIQSKTQS